MTKLTEKHGMIMTVLVVGMMAMSLLAFNSIEEAFAEKTILFESDIQTKSKSDLYLYTSDIDEQKSYELTWNGESGSISFDRVYESTTKNTDKTTFTQILEMTCEGVITDIEFRIAYPYSDVYDLAHQTVCTGTFTTIINGDTYSYDWTTNHNTYMVLNDYGDGLGHLSWTGFINDFGDIDNTYLP